MKQSRNELCSCGSGKKYKNCCMIKSDQSFIRKNGYKMVICFLLGFFIVIFYNTYIKAGPIRYYYECDRQVDANETGHQFEDPNHH